MHPSQIIVLPLSKLFDKFTHTA